MDRYPATPLERATDRAIAAENANPRGLPADIMADMEADILANPEKYPEVHRLLTDPAYRAQRRAEGPR